MSEPDDKLGHLDDTAEQDETSSDASGGPAAQGEYDPAEGSPGAAHPTGEDFPDEAVRYDEEGRPRSDNEG